MALQPALTETGAVDSSPAAGYQYFLNMSCTPPHCCCSMLSKKSRTLLDTYILHDGMPTSWAVQRKDYAELRVQHDTHKKSGGKIRKPGMYDKSYEGWDVMQRYLP